MFNISTGLTEHYKALGPITLKAESSEDATQEMRVVVPTGKELSTAKRKPLAYFALNNRSSRMP